MNDSPFHPNVGAGDQGSADVTQGESWSSRLSGDPLRLALVLLIFLTIGRLHQHYGVIGSVRPALVLFLFVMAYAVLKPEALSSTGLFKTWPSKVIVALGLMACASVPFALSVGNSGRFILEAYMKVLVTALLIIAAIRHAGDLRLFAWAYLAACAFVVWLSVGVFDLSSAGTAMRLDNLYMFDANGMGVILVVGLPLAAVMFQNSSGWPKALSLALIVGIGVSLARSGSRGGFLGLLVVGALILVYLHRVPVAKRLGLVGVVVAGLAFTAPEGYWSQMKSLTEPTKDYNWESDYGRRKIALRGLGYMADNPVLGVGIDNFQKAELELSELAERRRARGAGFRLAAAHNSFLQVGVEMGLPGLLLWCSLVFGGIFGVRRLRRRLPRGWRRRDPERRFVYDLTLYLPLCFAGFAVTAFFVSFAYRDVIYFLAALTAGTYVCARKLRQQDLLRQQEALRQQDVAPTPVAYGRRARRPRVGATAGP